MSQQFSSTTIISKSGINVNPSYCTSPHELGRNLGDAVWQQVEGDTEAILNLAEFFCALLTLPEAKETFAFITCLCKLLGVEMPIMPDSDSMRRYGEATYLSFSETVLSLQEDIRL